MVMKSVPPAPVQEEMLSVSWQRWFGAVASNSVGIYSLSASIAPSSVPAQSTATESFTVNGVSGADALLVVIKPTTTAGIGIAGYKVTGANTISITFVNPTIAPIVPPTEIYTFILIR